MPELAICLTTHGYPDTRVHAKLCLTNGYEFKLDFTTLLKGFDIKLVLTTFNKPQANALLGQVHQVIFNIIVSKDLDNKVFDHIYPWGETLAYIELAISASYRRTILATPDQSAFHRDILFNLAPVVDWRVVTAVK